MSCFGVRCVDSSLEIMTVWGFSLFAILVHSCAASVWAKSASIFAAWFSMLNLYICESPTCRVFLISSSFSSLSIAVYACLRLTSLFSAMSCLL